MIDKKETEFVGTPKVAFAWGQVIVAGILKSERASSVPAMVYTIDPQTGRRIKSELVGFEFSRGANLDPNSIVLAMEFSRGRLVIGVMCLSQQNAVAAVEFSVSSDGGTDGDGDVPCCLIGLSNDVGDY